MLARLRGRRRGEDGVVAIVVAIITCFTLIPMAALAVDIGVQRVARRDAQAVADLVAMDLARQLDGRTVSQISGTLQTLANKSAARQGANGFNITPQLGTLGTYDPSNPDSYFAVMTASNGVPTAVKVIVSGSVKFSIQADKTGSVTRTAIAKATAEACFKLGSFAAKVSTSGTLLNGLINDSLNLSVVGYQGLATSSITLGDLAAALGAGSPSELMALDHVSLGTLFSAAAHVLQSNGGSSANVALLNAIAGASFSGVTNTTVKMSDLFNLTNSTGNGSALATSLNLYDLVATTAFVANGSNFLAIPDITAGIPGLAPGLVSANLKVIQGPERTCGSSGTSMSTSQVTLNLTVNLPQTGISLGILGLLTTSSTLTASINLASATGTLTNVVCGPGATDGGADFRVDASLASVSTSLHVDIKSLGITAATVDTNTAATGLASSNTVSIRVPPDAYDTAKSTGAAPLFTNTSNITSSDVHLLGLSLGVVGSVVSGVNTGIIQAFVNPLTANLNTLLLTPLSGALGLRLAGGDVFLENHPVCNQPALAG
ncbi:MAG: pilus assembly protein TadG-related protein [Marmoricola sp.]